MSLFAQFSPFNDLINIQKKLTHSSLFVIMLMTKSEIITMGCSIYHSVHSLNPLGTTGNI